jgi:hypothetical protein
VESDWVNPQLLKLANDVQQYGLRMTIEAPWSRKKLGGRKPRLLDHLNVEKCTLTPKFTWCNDKNLVIKIPNNHQRSRETNLPCKTFKNMAGYYGQYYRRNYDVAQTP